MAIARKTKKGKTYETPTKSIRRKNRIMKSKAMYQKIYTYKEYRQLGKNEIIKPTDVWELSDNGQFKKMFPSGFVTEAKLSAKIDVPSLTGNKVGEAGVFGNTWFKKCWRKKWEDEL